MIDKKFLNDSTDVVYAIQETLRNTDTFCSVFDASKKGHVTYELHLDEQGNIKDQHSEMTSNDQILAGEIDVPEQDDLGDRMWELLSVYGGDNFKLMCIELSNQYIETVFGPDADPYDLQTQYDI